MQSYNVNLQVQIRTHDCSNYQDHPSRPTCVEAIAVRAGRDVFVIDLDTGYVNFIICDDGVLRRNVKRLDKYNYKVIPTSRC